MIKVISQFGGVEIKWSNRYFDKPQELKSLIKCCKTNKFESAVVTSIDQLRIKGFCSRKAPNHPKKLTVPCFHPSYS